MFCPKCGYNNDEDANFCKRCGNPLKKELNKFTGRKKVLFAICLILLAGIGLTSGVLLQSHNSVVTPNNTNNSTSTTNATSNVTASSSGPKLIDSGSTSGYNTVTVNDTSFGQFTYKWQTYEYNDQHILINGTLCLQDQGKTIKQTQDIRKFSDETVMITVTPKWTGNSGYQAQSTNLGYSTVTDYYWNYFKGFLMDNGPMGQ